MISFFRFVSGVGISIIGYKMLVASTLNNFKVSEFGASLPFLTVGLLVHLDSFADDLEKFFGFDVPVLISPDKGSLFRAGSSGQHGYGRAADIMFPNLDAGQLVQAYRIAKRHFTGVGISFVWKPYHGMHVDLRPSPDGRVATWGYDKINGVQTANLSPDFVINKYGVV